ncbi:MAG: helix-turn-helix domain-containing protein [Rhodoplanes sp.]
MTSKISDAEQQRPARQRAMSIAQFCERFNTGRTKAYEEIKSGRLRARKVGKRTIITEDDAAYWLERLPIIEVAQDA